MENGKEGHYSLSLEFAQPQNSMLECSICGTWHHTRCHGIKKRNIPDIWNCGCVVTSAVEARSDDTSPDDAQEAPPRKADPELEQLYQQLDDAQRSVWQQESIHEQYQKELIDLEKQSGPVNAPLGPSPLEVLCKLPSLEAMVHAVENGDQEALRSALHSLIIDPKYIELEELLEELLF